MPTLTIKIQTLGGVYKRYASSLEKLGIVRLGDFLYHVPFRYEDYALISKISQVQPGEVVTIRGKVLEIKNEYTRRYFVIQKAKIKDQSGVIDVVWFNQPYIVKSINQGDKVSLSGKIEKKGSRLQISNPDFELGEDEFIHTGRLVPIYPETRGVSSKWIRRQVFRLLKENQKEIEEYLPSDILNRNGLQNLFDAIYKIHFPLSLEEAEVAKKRLSFDELFLMQLSSLKRRGEWEKNLIGFVFDIKKYNGQIHEFIKRLPFELTSAQKKAISEIFTDFSMEKPMNRLLEGDVGSGKTVVAAAAMYLAYLNGFQSVLMAPTEILAQQHFKTISSLLESFGLRVELRTSSSKKNWKLETPKGYPNWKFDILIGTHAVIHKGVNFEKLGLVVIDEQQRFGVEQRSILRKKGDNPHVLTMTATPIPRTIALTMYGDLDLSILDEMPKGRRIIKTWLVPSAKRNGAYEWIKKQIKEKGSQVFIICPFIEESESIVTVKAATKEFENLKKNVFKNYKLALLHGKLKSKEKERVLSEFKNKKFDILVATPVVEVGIDIPNADIILIEASERFGLSQLHQLRGRVGRSERQAYCLLFTETGSPQTNTRLKAMEKTNFGAELAELDLKIRGPGEIYGTAQSGRNLLKIASFSDLNLIKQTKKEAEAIGSKLTKYPKLKQKIEEITVKEISPD
ncbi:MAG: ATP-dependent DNA helicase RecG [Candidatus Levybacteria bacterium]|nr:ATP-dependent DNA helicase RecG [Candidatus Levybacteria bacterium]